MLVHLPPIKDTRARYFTVIAPKGFHLLLVDLPTGRVTYGRDEPVPDFDEVFRPRRIAEAKKPKRKAGR